MEGSKKGKLEKGGQSWNSFENEGLLFFFFFNERNQRMSEADEHSSIEREGALGL